MNAFVPLPPQFHWTPQQLASAIPLHLGQWLAFDVARDGAAHAANRPLPRLRIAHGFRADAGFAPRFRIS